MPTKAKNILTASISHEIQPKNIGKTDSEQRLSSTSNAKNETITEER